MSGEELDRALYDCMGTVWKAYRESVESKNYKPFNRCFEPLYEKYTDPTVNRYIAALGMAYVDALNRRIKDAGN